MRYFLLVLFFSFIVANPSFSKYYLVQVNLKSQAEVEKLLRLNFDLEGTRVGKGQVNVIVNEDELHLLRQSGLEWSTLVEDYENHLAKQLEESYKKAKLDEILDFQLGSMSGFYLLDEIYAQFDNLSSRYSKYFVDIDTIGASWESRPIISYAFGSRNETAPKLLLTCLHHAREPGTVTTVLYALSKMLKEASQGNREYEFLFENLQLWVIPVVNPDGYYYNQTKFPKGGGMWRKNRRQINDTTFGVDLNRNYGPYEFWNAPNNGSSVNPRQETYRGPAPFSEPELVAIRDFCLQKKFKLALNYHTYGGMLIYPFSAISEETPDSNFYRSFGKYTFAINGYYFGKDEETVGYATRGSSDDWMYYQDSTKTKIIAMTPEAGYQFDGFWPPSERIIPIAVENFELIRNWLWSAFANIRLVDCYYLYDSNTDKGYIYATFQNIGTEDYNSTNFPIRITSINENYSFDTLLFASSLKSTEEVTLIVQLPKPVSNFYNGNVVNFQFSIEQYGVERRDTVPLVLFEYQRISLMEPENWILDNTDWYWEAYDDYLVLADSPNRNYADSVDNVLISKLLKLNFANAQLEFFSTWQIEPFYDFGLVYVFNPNYPIKQNLKSKHTVPASGNPYGRQTKGEFGYSGIYPYFARDFFDLSDFLGESVHFQLVLLSDRAKNYDGWDIYDIALRLYPFKEYSSAESAEATKLFFIQTNNKVYVFKIPNRMSPKSINVISVLGNVIHIVALESHSNQIQLPNLPDGCYFLQFVGEGEVSTEKLIILK